MKKLFTLLLVALVGMLPMMAQTEVTATFDFTDLANLDPNPSVSPYPNRYYKSRRFTFRILL